MKIKSILYWPVFWLIARFLRWHTNVVVGKAFKELQNTRHLGPDIIWDFGPHIDPTGFVDIAWGSVSLYQMCRAFNHSLALYRNRKEDALTCEAFKNRDLRDHGIKLMIFWREYPKIELKKGKAFCVRARLAIVQVTKEFYEDVK